MRLSSWREEGTGATAAAAACSPVAVGAAPGSWGSQNLPGGLSISAVDCPVTLVCLRIEKELLTFQLV